MLFSGGRARQRIGDGKKGLFERRKIPVRDMAARSILSYITVNHHKSSSFIDLLYSQFFYCLSLIRPREGREGESI